MLHVILRNVLEERAELRLRPRSRKTVWQQRREKATSGGGQESPDGRSPLPLRAINLGDFTRPGSREVDGWPDKESEVFLRTCGPDLLVEFECFSGQVSAHIEQYQVIHIGLPQKARSAEILGRMYLDAMTLQNPDPHVACRLVTIDEQNFLISKNWLATKWWRAIHTPPPKGKRNWADCPPAGCGSQGTWKYKRSQRPRCFYRMGAALSKSETANTKVAFLEPLVLV
jgi:hypothetical protein